MRLLFTTDYYPPHLGGGVEVVVSELATRFADAGDEVRVLTLDTGSSPAEEVIEGVSVHRFRSVRLSRITGLELAVSVESFRSMRSLIQDFKPDLVNAHHLFFTTTPPALRAARTLNVPSVLTLHIADLAALSGWKGIASRLYHTVVAHRLYQQAHALVAVSNAVAESIPEGVSRPTFVVPNGVDLERFAPTSATPGEATKFVFVGRLIANKGPVQLLHAFRDVHASHPDTTLTFVGDGPLKSSLLKFVRRHGLERCVHFPGMSRNVAAGLRESDVFVRPSTVEGMPLTALEAMAAGLPVIVSDVGGVREVVEHGVSGYLVPPGSTRETAAAMRELTVRPEVRLAMGRAARRRVEQGFTWEAVAAGTRRAFTAVLDSTDG